MAEVTSVIVLWDSILFTFCMEKPFISWSLCSYKYMRLASFHILFIPTSYTQMIPNVQLQLISSTSPRSIVFVPHDPLVIFFEMLMINLLDTLLLYNRCLGEQQVHVPWGPCSVQAARPGPNCGAGYTGFTWNSHRGCDGSQPIFLQHAFWPVHKQPRGRGDHLCSTSKKRSKLDQVQLVYFLPASWGNRSRFSWLLFYFSTERCLWEDSHGLTAHPHSCVGKYRLESGWGENVRDSVEIFSQTSFNALQPGSFFWSIKKIYIYQSLFKKVMFNRIYI